MQLSIVPRDNDDVAVSKHRCILSFGPDENVTSSELELEYSPRLITSVMPLHTVAAAASVPL